MYIILVICGWVPNRRCETGFFLNYYYYLLRHILFPLHLFFCFFLFVQYVYL